MAFQPQNLARVSVSTNEEITDIINNQVIDTASPAPGNPGYPLYLKTDCKGCFRTYNYFSKWYTGTTTSTVDGDTQDTIASPEYFDLAAGMLQVGDIIHAYSAADNTYITYNVTATPTVANPNASVTVAPAVTGAVEDSVVTNSTVTNTKIIFSTIANCNYQIETHGPFSGNDLLNLSTTPIQIIAGVPNTIIIINSVVFCSSDGAGFTGGSNIWLGYYYVDSGTPTTVPASTYVNPSILTGTNSRISIEGFAPFVTIYATSSIVGVGIYLMTGSPFISAGTKELELIVNYSLYPALKF